MTDDIEVLVHISTPATRQNDELYRSLAHAYTEFEPYQTYRDQSWRRVKTSDGAKSSHVDTTPAPTKATPQELLDSVPVASKEMYGSFPSNLSSDGLRQQDHESFLDDSARTTSRLAQLDRSYINWRRRTTSLTTSKHDKANSTVSSDGLEDADTGFIEDSQSALQAVQSQLQDVYSTTSADTSDDGHQEEAVVGSESQAGEHSLPMVLCDTAAEDISLPGPLEETIIADVRPSPLEESTLLFQRPTEFSQDEFDSTLDRLDFSTLPLDAFPPPPPISVETPKTLPSQITKHLAVIKARNPDRFRPLKIRRNLIPDERGYWRIDCTRWSLGLQQEFWSSLYDHVCSGRIGWGTTLHRESTSGRTLGVVRLYCWCEVLEHFWLLLWLCSKGEVAKLDLKWIDADGVAVLEMG